MTQFSLDDLKTLKTTYLHAKDQIVLYTKSVTQNLNPTVRVIGKVKNPGDVCTNEHDVFRRCNFKCRRVFRDRRKRLCNVNRLDRNLEEGTYSKLTVSNIDIDYLLGLKKTPSNPFILENYDIISVICSNKTKFSANDLRTR